MSTGSTGQQDILREYLISLGFKTNTLAEQRFAGNITKLDKSATHLGRTLAGLAVGAQTMVTTFAFQMERLYYSSKLAESSAANLADLGFAGKQIGLPNLTANIEAFAAAMRSNPGYKGLLHSLGIETAGREMTEIFKDFVKRTKEMPFYIGERFASMFGISPNDLLLLQQGIDKLEEASRLRKDAFKDLGIDQDKAAEAGREYAQQWREILMYADGFTKKLSLEMLPFMRELAGVTKNVLTDWTRIVSMPTDKFLEGMRVGLGLEKPGGGVELSPQAKERLGRPTEKSYADMTDEERIASGKAKRFFGRIVPQREQLTDAERRALNLPTRDEEGWVDKANNWLVKKQEDLAVGLGLKSPGGVELSSQSKERLGGDRTKASNPSPMREAWESMIAKLGYQSKRKTAVDPEAIEAATEPDRLAIERDQKLEAHPDIAKRFEEAMRAGNYGTARTLIEQLDQMAYEPPADAAPLKEQPDPKKEQHGDERAWMRKMEKRYGLPTGLLDYQWKAESARGKFMQSPAGAQGHFGFMPPTAQQYGLADPNNFAESAKAAAAYMADLLKKFGGDLRYALAAYNWGPGKLEALLSRTMSEHGDWSQEQVDRYVLGKLPAETKAYVANALGAQAPGAANGVQLNAETNINVYETGSAKDTAREVANNQRAVYSDVVRQLAPRIQ